MQKFSVAMSVYKSDNSQFFDRALESITTLQTIKPDEICLVVDGPVSDEINSVIGKYEKEYCINTLRLEKNGGLGNALRIAVEASKYDLIARMDSDDVALPNRFEQQLLFFDKYPNVDILGGNISEFIDEETNIVSYRNVPQENEQIKKYLKKRCPFNHMTVMFKKNSIIKCGNYQSWHYNEDYYLWIRMAINSCIFANLDKILVNVRIGSDMYARRGGKKYFKSEKELQKYMLKNKIVKYPTYLNNVLKRWLVQVCMPNKLRGWVFRKFARSKKY